MARCKSCSAPLLANTNRCQYCDVRNDVDLHAKHKFTVVKNDSDRTCPHCEKILQTIQIPLDKTFFIERCGDCFGLFFHWVPVLNFTNCKMYSVMLVLI